MTDFDPTPDDEIVSAYLDGEATPAERAVVEGDPRLLARVAEFRAVASAVGVPVPPADDARDRLIAQALTAAGPVAPVVSLDAARRRRQRIGVAIASVAAALVALLALPVLLDDGSSDDQTAAVETADDSADGADASGDGEGGDEATPEAGTDDGAIEDWENGATGEPDATTPRSTVLSGVGGPEVLPVAPAADADDLGAFATRPEAQLAISEAIDAALVESERLRDTGMLEYRALTDGTCDAATRAGDDELVGLVYAATFDLAGVPHQVLVYDLIQTGAQNGTHRVYEVTLPACTQVSVETI